MVHGGGFEAFLVEGGFEDAFADFGGEAAVEVGLEFLEEKRDAIGAAKAVADGEFDDDFGEDGAVGEFYGESVGDGTLGGVVVVGGELRVFDAGDEGAEVVDAVVGGYCVFVVFGGEAAEDQGDGDHVLDAVVAVGGVVEGSLLVDDADAGFVGADGDVGDVGGGLSECG